MCIMFWRLDEALVFSLQHHHHVKDPNGIKVWWL